jgi:hypothetical protein
VFEGARGEKFHDVDTIVDADGNVIVAMSANNQTNNQISKQQTIGIQEIVTIVDMDGKEETYKKEHVRLYPDLEIEVKVSPDMKGFVLYCPEGEVTFRLTQEQGEFSTKYQQQGNSPGKLYGDINATLTGILNRATNLSNELKRIVHEDREWRERKLSVDIEGLRLRAVNELGLFFEYRVFTSFPSLIENSRAIRDHVEYCIQENESPNLPNLTVKEKDTEDQGDADAKTNTNTNHGNLLKERREYVEGEQKGFLRVLEEKFLSDSILGLEEWFENTRPTEIWPSSSTDCSNQISANTNTQTPCV